MAAIEKRTISLPADQAGYVDSLVERGRYGSASEVVRAGLLALQERDESEERWLREQVAPVHDAMQAEPARAIPAEEVFARLRAHHGRTLKPAGDA